MSTLPTETLKITIAAPFERVVSDLADGRSHGEWATEFFAGPVSDAGDGSFRAVVPAMGGPSRMRISADIGLGVIDLYLAPEGKPFGPPLPVRVVRNGNGADVLWTLARFPGTPDAAWDEALASMERELESLRARLESSPGSR